MVLPGGSPGTTFEDMTIEGEDKIQIEFERPPLDLDLDPREAPGLDWDHRLDVLDRHRLSFDRPLLAVSALRRSPYLARPWLTRFAAAPVARFHPQVQGVERWMLTVADSRGETVARFEGKGKVPKEIAWDGSTLSGPPASPGLVYSYVFEAYDRAGNKRNFMGDGFELPPYRIEKAGVTTLLFSAEELGTGGSHPVLLLEAASWINQTAGIEEPILVEAKARTYEEARILAEQMIRFLGPHVLGDAMRLRPAATVEADAPLRGTASIRWGG
jgi:hypothetical protein